MRSVFFLFTLLLFLFIPQKARAENFSSSLEGIYTIFENGTAHVTYHVKLTNTTSKYFASSYSINLGFQSIYDVAAKDEQGEIAPDVTQKNGIYTIDMSFNKPVVGIGNTRLLTISFNTPDIAKKRGSIWEFTIPEFSRQDDYESFDVTIEYPPSFGRPSYIKPALPVQTSATIGRLKFTKENLKKSGISIAFGEKQVYSFVLKYHLKNKNLFSVKKEIALPPYTSYQTVYIQLIEPNPEQVTLDSDGNLLAQYSLSSLQSLDIKVGGIAEVFLNPKKGVLSDEEQQEYLKEDKYWQVSDSSLKKTAQRLRTPDKIYQYVVENLSYDFSRVTDNKPRMGAKDVLIDKTSASCLEFTDLFIALSRSADIPAREVNGFAYTENVRQKPLSLVKDVLHAWPEYYDRGKQTWVMVDPTWGKTTGEVDYFHAFDFEHLAFVIKGQSSMYPMPAGGYKVLSQKEAKDVSVTFTDAIPKPVSNLDAKVSIDEKASSFFPVGGTVKITNSGNSISQGKQIIITSEHLTPKFFSISLDPIPPFGHRTISFELKPKFLTNQKDKVTIRVDNKTYTHTIFSSPFILSKK